MNETRKDTLNPFSRTMRQRLLTIEAMDQNSAILDQIRQEIEALPNANPSYSGYIDVIDREDVLEIIDKYI